MPEIVNTPRKGIRTAEAPPSLFIHCTGVYDRMAEECVKKVIDGEDLVVYEGFLSRLVTSQMHLSVPYYSTVTNCLKDMGCIRQIKRGGGSAMSVWELLRNPTPDRFEEWKEAQAVARGSLREDEAETASAKAKRMEDIDDLRDAFHSMQRRLNELEEFQRVVYEFFATEDPNTLSKLRAPSSLVATAPLVAVSTPKPTTKELDSSRYVSQ